MKFNNIKIPDEVTQTKGIAEIDIQRLSNVVVLVGKNGSGKSRILRLIEENLFKQISILQILDSSISHLPKNLEKFANKLTLFRDYYLTQEKIQLLNQQLKKDSSNFSIKQALHVAKMDLKKYTIQPSDQKIISRLATALAARV